MADTRIVLAGLWAAVMLTYLLGDVIRIFAGHIEPGKLNGEEADPRMWLLIAVIMLVPIVMVVLSLVVPFPVVRTINIAAAIVVILFNLMGLPYEGSYDNFLIIVSFVFNGLTIWYAWNWAG